MCSLLHKFTATLKQAKLLHGRVAGVFGAHLLSYISVEREFFEDSNDVRYLLLTMMDITECHGKNMTIYMYFKISGFR